MKDKISTRQVCALIVLETLGAGFVAVPCLALLLSGRDGLAAIIIAASVTAAYAVFTVKCMQKYGGADMFAACEKAMGSVSAAALRCGFAVKAVLFSGFCLRVFAETATEVIESDIPYTAVMLTMGLLILYVSSGGAKVRSRLAELLVLPVAAVLIFIFLCGISGQNGDELLPVFAEKGSHILAGSAGLALWFYPLEYVLTDMPHISVRDGRLIKSCVKAVLFSGFIMAGVFALTLIRFGAEQMADMSYPVLEMMYSVNLPGSFIERQEGLMLGIWTCGVFFSAGGAIYHGACRCEEIFKLSPLPACTLCAAAALVVGMLPSGGAEAMEYMTAAVLFAEAIYLVVLPLVLCTAACIGGVKK